VILPTAVMVALAQIFLPSDFDRLGWLGAGRQQVSASDAPSSAVERAEAPGSERHPPPESVRRSTEPRSPLPNLSAPASRAGPADVVASTVEPASIRVFIHHVAGTGNALPAIKLAAHLHTQGFAVTGIRAVDVPIERPTVRYFFAADQLATRRLIEAIAAFFAEVPGQTPDEVPDFSHSSPKSRRGHVEVWLPAPAAVGHPS
jgi:hypothetical protein